MLAVLKVQLQKLLKNPASVLIMIGMTILFTVMLGLNSYGKVTVHTYHDASISREEAESWLELLNKSNSFIFSLTEESAALDKVTDGKAQFVLKLIQDDYRIIASMEDMNTSALDVYLRTVYDEELKLRSIEEQMPGEDVRTELEQKLAHPVLSIHATEVKAEGDYEYDSRIQSLFGFSLFFSFYTIAYAVNELLQDKKNGIWDRVILSPISKLSMYSGHLANSFLIGYLQIVIVFLLFRYGFSFPLGDSLATILLIAAIYTFAIVALGLLMAGLVKTPQQMSVLIPIVAVSSAMIGGAYWPIEIVTNPILLLLSKIVPITYGMEALKGVAYYDYGWSELLYPLSVMCLFGVVCMGIGINLIERRAR